MAYNITDSMLEQYSEYLKNQERAPATIEKYLRDIRCFTLFLEDATLTAETLRAYKAYLQENYKPASVNSMLTALNQFFDWCKWDFHLKALKIQRKVFRDENLELTKEEYLRLLDTAKKRGERLWLLLQTICSTGIRVSELKYITVEAAKRGRADISFKGKSRTILIPSTLCRELLRYSKLMKIKSGPIFLTRTGQLMNRSNIWRALKSLCEAAGVLASKVFPHNLRHLFATTFYNVAKDIARLADVLGHSSINTTRIYISTSGSLHSRIMEGLGLAQSSEYQKMTT